MNTNTTPAAVETAAPASQVATVPAPVAPKVSKTVTLVKEKECKGSVRYILGNEDKAAPFTNVYLSRNYNKGDMPESINVTITSVDKGATGADILRAEKECKGSIRYEVSKVSQAKANTTNLYVARTFSDPMPEAVQVSIVAA